MILKPRAFWKTSYVIPSGWLHWLGKTHAFVRREALVQENPGAAEHRSPGRQPPLRGAGG